LGGLWFAASLFSVLAGACEAGQRCPTRGAIMKHDQLKVCVESLRAFRAQKHKELNASAGSELDEVIRSLECCLSNEDDVAIDWKLNQRTLEIMAKCLELTTNLSSLIRVFFGGD